jgi:hypothetical protein
MDIIIYFDRLEKNLDALKGVSSIEKDPIARVSPGNRGKITARIHFFDESILDLKQIVETTKCYPQFVKYEYQYSKGNETIFRYDNSRHHPEIPTYPCHKHNGSDENNEIVSSDCPSLENVIEEIYQWISNN